MLIHPDFPPRILVLFEIETISNYLIYRQEDRPLNSYYFHYVYYLKQKFKKIIEKHCLIKLVVRKKKCENFNFLIIINSYLRKVMKKCLVIYLA